MRSKIPHKLWLPLIAVVLIVSACGGGGGDGAGNSGSQGGGAPQVQETGGEAQGKVPLKLAYFVGWNVPSMSARDNQALQYIEDKLGVQLDLTVLMLDLYREKLRVMMSGGDIPDAFAWDKIDNFVIELIESGTIVPLDDLIAQYPHLDAQKDLYKSSYKGQTWAVPNVRNPIASGDIPMIRQDWLDNLGLTAPRTSDELYDVARAFTYDDPDGNGRKDTYGIQLTNLSIGWSLAGAGGLEQMFGLSDDWVKQDGKYVPKFATDRYKEFLTWMSRAFKEGLIDPDFAVTDTALAESKVTREGKAGIFFHYSTRIYDFEDNFQKEHPEARLVGFEAVQGPHGDRGINSRINLGGIFISKKAADDPVKLAKIMEWLDYGASEEGGIFWNYGVEGIHYHKDANGEITLDEAAYQKDMPRTFSWTLPVQPTDEVYVFPQNSKEAQNAVVSAHRMNEPYIKHNETAYVFSETRAKHDTESVNFLRDNLIQTIMGAKSVDEWDNVVAEWYKRFEGDKAAEEIAVAMGD